ncbi:MAG: hypothetical protein IJ223_06745 [Clostridia bacterium]|nr:hypothetical protein [Clostridia bacterium]
MRDILKRKLERIQGDLEYIGWNLADTKEEINNLWDELLIRQNNSIRDIENLKRELKRDNLYSKEIEDFLQNYMKYYNK